MKLKKYFMSFIYNVMLVSLCFNNIAYAVDMGAITDPLTEITEVLLIIGAGVCIAKVIHIGILYVTSSAVDKSNAKMAILPWLVGTFLCFGAAVIGPAIIEIFKVDKPVLSY